VTGADLSSFVKAYDVRGLVGSELTPEVVEALAAGFVDELGAAGTSVVVGHDMRDSSPEFAVAFARGASARGADVINIGLCSTDETYFASGWLDAPAAMFTASHNPARYNGIKLSRAGAQGISIATGLGAIRTRAEAYLDAGGVPSVGAPGTVTTRDVLPDYAAHLRSLVDLTDIRPLRVVVDAGNGMGGLTVPAVLGTAAGLPGLPLEIIPLYFELDGTFPNHEANPLEPENLRDLQAAVVANGADLGLAFDGDADRCFVVDETGAPVSPSAVAAIVAQREVARVRAAGETGEVFVIHNLITSRFVPEAIGRRAPCRCAPTSATRSSRTGCGRRAPSSAASTRPTTTSAISGAPTTACSRRCTCSPSSGVRVPRSRSSRRPSTRTPCRARSTRPSMTCRRPTPASWRRSPGGASSTSSTA